MNQSPRSGAEESAPADGPLTEAIQTKLQNLIIQLVKEMDASIGFFVSQQEVTVNQAYVSGGSARSQFIVQTLEVELGLPCETWNPTRSLTMELPPKQRQEIEYDAIQLAVAIGAGYGALNEELISLNLLADELEAAETRRLDPVRRGFWVAAAAVAIMLLWAAWLGLQFLGAGRHLAKQESELKEIQNQARESLTITGEAGEIERTLAALQRVGTNRFLWATTLNALQHTAIPEIQFHRLRMEQTVIAPPAPKPAAKNAKTGKAGSTNSTPPAIERTVLTIQAKNYGEVQSMDRFIETVSSHPFFTNALRREQPVSLANLQPRQVDPADPSKSFLLFTTECVYSERTLKDD